MVQYPNNGFYKNNGLYQNNGIYRYNGLYKSSDIKDITELSVYPKIGYYWDFSDTSKHTLDVDNKIERHAPTKGNIDLIQTTSSRRPEKLNDWLKLGVSRSENIGLVTDGDVSYYEIFTLVNYDDGLNFTNDSTFSGSNTLIGGSTFGGSDQRIAGQSGTSNLLTSYSVDVSGRVRINNASESSSGVLPLGLSVLHAANFNGSVNHTDTISFGYAQAQTGRGWTGFSNCLILMNAETTEAERAELVEWLTLKKQLSNLPQEELLSGDVEFSSSGFSDGFSNGFN